MGAVIAVANRKGGVGKTTVSAHLAAGLARRGLRVIAVDCDPQGNLTSLLLNGAEDDGLYRMLVAKRMPALETLLRVTDQHGPPFGLLSGDVTTSDALAMLAIGQRLGDITARIRELGERVDVVLLDMPPSQAVGFRQLLNGADWLLVVSVMERLAVEGVAQMVSIAVECNTRLMGIVPNMVRETVEHRENGRALVERLGDRADLVWAPIPHTVRIAEAQAYGQMMFDYEPKGKATAALRGVVERVVGVLEV